jgi:hypothetical protein
MLRQRESRELRLLSSGIEVTPPAALTWAHDVFGNAMATAAFAAPTDRLVIASGVELELAAEPWPVLDIAAAALTWPSPTRRRIRLDSNSVDPCRSDGVSVETWEDDREQSGFEIHMERNTI